MPLINEKLFKISISLYWGAVWPPLWRAGKFYLPPPYTIQYRKIFIQHDIGFWCPKSDVLMVGIDYRIDKCKEGILVVIQVDIYKSFEDGIHSLIFSSRVFHLKNNNFISMIVIWEYSWEIYKYYANIHSKQSGPYNDC